MMFVPACELMYISAADNEVTFGIRPLTTFNPFGEVDEPF